MSLFQKYLFMEMTQLIWLLRIIIGLIIGLLAARKMRELIRSIVIRCIPLKHRISERSFQLQTRATTVVAILVAIGIAIGLNYGLSKALEKTDISKSTLITSPSVMPQPALKKKEADKGDPPSITTPEPAIKFQEQPISDYEWFNNKEATSVTKTNKKIAYPMTKKGYAAPALQRLPSVYQIPHYAQIYAFDSFQRAKRQQVLWTQQHSLPIWVGYAEGSQAPYKVLVGPFENRAEATWFLKVNSIEGFPKPAHQLQVFKE